MTCLHIQALHEYKSLEKYRTRSTRLTQNASLTSYLFVTQFSNQTAHLEHLESRGVKMIYFHLNNLEKLRHVFHVMGDTQVSKLRIHIKSKTNQGKKHT